MRSMLSMLFVLAVANAFASALPQEPFRTATPPIATRWTKTVTPENAHREHPRPSLVRPDWLNLNGLWKAAFAKTGGKPAETLDYGDERTILVPFPIESALSGVMRRVEPDEAVRYERTFTLPEAWKGRRTMLRFGAVDHECSVFVNKKAVGAHAGGYDGFAFDITDVANFGAENTLVVYVVDPTDLGTQARGKQVRKPGGIFYTPTSGIWQTVWLEAVPPTRIERIKTNYHLGSNTLAVDVETRGAGRAHGLKVSLCSGGVEVAVASATAGEPLLLRPEKPRLWSPESPELYDLVVDLIEAGKSIDHVESYCALRTISAAPGADGLARLHLNGRFLFLLGPLDQGFWPDGLYTAPSDEALRFDLEVTKDLGFNAVRKHVKVEPERWYYWCDKLGLAVIQDMPSHELTDEVRATLGAPDKVRAATYTRELEALVRGREFHPSVIAWVVFNEGWGQHETPAYVDFVRSLDRTRLVVDASGWTDSGSGDVHDIHVYPGPGSPDPTARRIAFLGEFGGLGLPLEGHTWQKKDNWGYVSYPTKDALTDAYVALIENLRPLIASPGLSGAIYTQTTDVEIEVNGLMTYDRELKMDRDRVRAVNERVHIPAPPYVALVPISAKEKALWRMTTAAPADGWQNPGFDDAAWIESAGGFGTKETPGARVGTEWTTAAIWLRRTIELGDDLPTDLMIHHDEDARIFVNGKLVLELPGYTTGYQRVSIPESARSAFKKGPNLIAVTCRQTRGGQFIDLGFGR